MNGEVPMEPGRSSAGFTVTEELGASDARMASRGQTGLLARGALIGGFDPLDMTKKCVLGSNIFLGTPMRVHCGAGCAQALGQIRHRAGGSMPGLLRCDDAMLLCLCD